LRHLLTQHTKYEITKYLVSLFEAKHAFTQDAPITNDKPSTNNPIRANNPITNTTRARAKGEGIKGKGEGRKERKNTFPLPSTQFFKVAILNRAR